MATQKIFVNNFYGGKNNETSPHLINKNQGTFVSNLTLEYGSLRRALYTQGANALITTQADNTVFYHNNGTNVSLGIDDKYKAVKPVRFQDYTYLLHGADGSQLPHQLRGSSLYSIIVSEGNLSTSSITTPLNTGYTSSELYSYSYYLTYRTDGGIESPLHKLAEIKAGITNTSVETIQLTLPATRDLNQAISIYRTGKDIVVPARVCIITSADVVTDFEGSNSSDSSVTVASNVVSIRVLDKYIDEVTTKATNTNPPGGFNFLTANRYGMAGSGTGVLANILYLSYGRPDAWNTLDSLNLAGAITGLTYTERGILVFTESNYLYYITGTNSSNLTVNIINEDIGCSSHKSIAKLRDGSIVWLYKNDLYKFNGGTSVQNITYGKYTPKLYQANGDIQEITNSVSLDNKYILGTDTGITVFDFDLNGAIVDYTLLEVNDDTIELFSNLQTYYSGGSKHFGYYKADYSFYEISVAELEILFELFDIGDYTTPSNTTDASNIVFGSYDNNIVDNSEHFAELGCYISDCGDGASNTDKGIYISPDFYGNTTDDEIILNSLDIVHIGDLDITLIVDDNIVATETLVRSTKGVSRAYYPVGRNRGLYTSVKLEISDTVFSYSINYEATPID